MKVTYEPFSHLDIWTDQDEYIASICEDAFDDNGESYDPNADPWWSGKLRHKLFVCGNHTISKETPVDVLAKSFLDHRINKAFELACRFVVDHPASETAKALLDWAEGKTLPECIEESVDYLDTEDWFEEGDPVPKNRCARV